MMFLSSDFCHVWCFILFPQQFLHFQFQIGAREFPVEVSQDGHGQDEEEGDDDHVSLPSNLHCWSEKGVGRGHFAARFPVHG